MWWSKVKLWCSHNWRILLVSSIILVSYLAGRKGVAKQKTKLKLMKDAYEKERKVLEGLDQELDSKQKIAINNYQKAMNLASKEMHESRDELRKQKAERVRELIEMNKRNPQVIDEILESEFGIKTK
tara:strand:- start:607 stop:987 length:381 start_codon:yes stop_codon:yes gene_type:complete